MCVPHTEGLLRVRPGPGEGSSITGLNHEDLAEKDHNVFKKGNRAYIEQPVPAWSWIGEVRIRGVTFDLLYRRQKSEM